MMNNIIITDSSLRDGNHSVKHTISLDSIKKYCKAADKAGIPIKNMCQFSWFCDGKPETISNRKLYEKSVEIAERVYYRSLSGERDPTEGALWYHAEYVTPYWAKTYTKQLQIGAHIFYSR